MSQNAGEASQPDTSSPGRFLRERWRALAKELMVQVKPGSTLPTLNRREDIEFMGETAAAALQGPPAYSHFLIWGTLAFVAAFVAWAAFATLGETTVGEGKVIPSSQVQVVQNLEGGIVSEIKIRVGDVVRKNQIGRAHV